MTLRTIGLLLLAAMLLTAFVIRDLLHVEVPYWTTTLLGVLGIVALGVHHYQQQSFKRFALMLAVYLLVFAVLIVIQFTKVF